MRHFGRLASSNPVLYVEALFQQPYAQKFCEDATSHFIDPLDLQAFRVRPLET